MHRGLFAIKGRNLNPFCLAANSVSTLVLITKTQQFARFDFIAQLTSKHLGDEIDQEIQSEGKPNMKYLRKFYL